MKDRVQEVSCSFYCDLGCLLNCKIEPYSPPIPFFFLQQSWAQLRKTVQYICPQRQFGEAICSCMQNPLIFNKLSTISCIYTSPTFSCITINALLLSEVWHCSKHLCWMDEFMLPWKVSWEKPNCSNFFSTSKGIFLIIWGLSKSPFWLPRSSA